MKLEEPLKDTYSKEKYSALEAQRLAEEIAFGPVNFQVARLMIKFGIFELLNQHKNGLTLDDITSQLPQYNRYTIQILLESSLTMRTVLLKDDRFFLAKTGWFLLNDQMARVNIDFNHDVNYLGFFYLEEALLKGEPAGLKTLGNWPTIYEGLSSLPKEAQKSWFAFDHFYSDNSFKEALEIVFAQRPKTLLDVGGNTGRWATQCVAYNPDIRVTIMDLPQQLQMMREQTKSLPGADRISGHAANLLDETVAFPQGFDVIWMSQFLDCFSEAEVQSILKRAAASMAPGSKLFIMENFWDRQQFDTAAYCIAQISLYFTAMANGNSKMYYSQDMVRCVEKAGLKVEKFHDMLGLGHTILECSK